MNKEDSVVLQGIAVLMMLVLHFFLDVNVYPQSFFMFPEIFQRFAWTGRMCVAIFSFVSGYGMYQVLKKKEGVGNIIKDCTKRLFQLYARLFLVIMLCVYLPRLLLGEEILISQLPGNIIGYNTVYNGAWWFVLEYMWFMLLAPVLSIIVNSKQRTSVRISLTFILMLLGMFGKGVIFTNEAVVNFFEVRMQPTFLVIFTEGFLSGKIQEVMAGMKWTDQVYKLVTKVRKPVFGVLLGSVAFMLRYLYSTDPCKANVDILLVLVFCCGVSLWLKKETILKKIFLFMGKNSFYLWLVHNLVYDRLFLFLIPRTGYWLVFFIILFVVSIIVSVLSGRIEKIICNCMWKCRKQ